MSGRDAERLQDILIAINAIRDHLHRGDLADGLVFDAVRMRLLEIGEAAKGINPSLLKTELSVPWEGVARMRDRLAHHCFDTSHAILEATMDEDFPQLEMAIKRLIEGQL